jgi:hypothetical protein
MKATPFLCTTCYHTFFNITQYTESFSKSTRIKVMLLIKGHAFNHDLFCTAIFKLLFRCPGKKKTQYHGKAIHAVESYMGSGLPWVSSQSRWAWVDPSAGQSWPASGPGEQHSCMYNAQSHHVQFDPGKLLFPISFCGLWVCKNLFS